ncbi:MAG: hypothetical protein HC845_02915 [Akkermansiaceae bacterium]|nr:hypothetical protein [Akkermansiaceae bacterium]
MLQLSPNNLSNFLTISAAFAVTFGGVKAEISSGQTGSPKVTVTTGSKPVAPARAATYSTATKTSYPWKTYVTCTVFWIGETPTDRNPTPNTKSSWDQDWVSNFGGFDDPEPANRIANHATGEFRPKNFIPKLNPFYIALPYNDVEGYGRHKPEASRVIPWFSRMRPEPGKTVCKGRWVQIFNGKIFCYAQWEDCGPWTTDDWEFVFGNKSPKTTQNGAAGIDLSPAIRDYLNLTSGKKVHWRFVEASAVPPGPWKRFGQSGTNPQYFASTTPAQKAPAPKLNPVATAPKPDAAQLRNLAYLRKVREKQALSERQAAKQLRQN